jgi:hypothetical protein
MGKPSLGEALQKWQVTKPHKEGLLLVEGQSEAA